MMTILLVFLGILLAIAAVAMFWLSSQACLKPDPAYQPNDWVIMLFIALGLSGLSVFIFASILQ